MEDHADPAAVLVASSCDKDGLYNRVACNRGLLVKHRVSIGVRKNS